MVKVGLTLDPMERIRELSDASVPFNAVGIETALHDRLAELRVNIVNRRREFFHATPLEVKAHMAELAGEMLEFQELPEALEYRQSLRGIRAQEERFTAAAVPIQNASAMVDQPSEVAA